VAEIGRGFSHVSGEIPLELSNSYGQFNQLHLNRRGVVD
jgi:hypothetical protein